VRFRKEPSPKLEETLRPLHLAEAQCWFKSQKGTAFSRASNPQEKIGQHPEIGAAITKLEMALNDLAIQTGGLL